ncbi:DUF7010 family protein [Paenibacillus sp. NPDC057886]|uniref:DUF7010 family protein n=1 Tax=Paenibacillus sp. NPDC057886 TaxID=3346270 RepID=UPI0036ADD7E0
MGYLVKLPKAAVFGAANGVMFMTFFGALWSSIGIIGSNKLGAPWLLVLSGIVTLTLLIGAISLFGKARNVNHVTTPKEREMRNKVNRKFGMICGLEGLAILIASVLCNLFDRFEVFFPIMAIIVGVHFFPLARLFRENFYYGTGIVLSILRHHFFVYTTEYHFGRCISDCEVYFYRFRFCFDAVGDRFKDLDNHAQAIEEIGKGYALLNQFTSWSPRDSFRVKKSY